MSKDIIRQNRAVSTRLHPLVYMAMASLALWLIISVWGFASDGYADWLLAVVSGFICIVVTLLFVLSRVGSHDPGAGKSKVRKAANFHDWAGGEFSTWQDKIRGRNAAIEILLPLAAVAFGMTAIAIVYLTVHTS